MPRVCIPRSVKIGPYDFRVRLVGATAFKDDKEQAGGVDFQQFRIEILRSLPRAKKQEVLLHEIWHAVHYIAGVGDDKPRTDEEWIVAITPTSLHVIRENPDLLEYLRS